MIALYIQYGHAQHHMNVFQVSREEIAAAQDQAGVAKAFHDGRAMDKAGFNVTDCQDLHKWRCPIRAKCTPIEDVFYFYFPG